MHTNVGITQHGTAQRKAQFRDSQGATAVSLEGYGGGIYPYLNQKEADAKMPAAAQAFLDKRTEAMASGANGQVTGGTQVVNVDAVTLMVDLLKKSKDDLQKLATELKVKVAKTALEAEIAQAIIAGGYTGEAPQS